MKKLASFIRTAKNREGFHKTLLFQRRKEFLKSIVFSMALPHHEHRKVKLHADISGEAHRTHRESLGVYAAVTAPIMLLSGASSDSAG